MGTVYTTFTSFFCILWVLPMLSALTGWLLSCPGSCRVALVPLALVLTASDHLSQPVASRTQQFSSIGPPIAHYRHTTTTHDVDDVQGATDSVPAYIVHGAHHVITPAAPRAGAEIWGWGSSSGWRWVEWMDGWKRVISLGNSRLGAAQTICQRLV